MITEIGKLLRNIRMDNDELLMEMAEKLEVSPAFLSSIEHGRKKAHGRLIERIFALYTLSEEQREKIQSAFSRSIKTFTIEARNREAQETAAVLARRFDSLSEDQLKMIRKMVGGIKDDEQ